MLSISGSIQFFLGKQTLPISSSNSSTPPAGSLDTSLVSTDNINNPRTMNAVYYLGPRMGVAKQWGKGTLAGGDLNNKQFNDFVSRSFDRVLSTPARSRRRKC